MTIIDTAALEPVLTIRPGATVQAQGARVVIQDRRGRREIGLGAPPVARAVASLDGGASTSAALSDLLLDTGGTSALAQVATLQVALRRFADVGLIDHLAVEDGVEIARLTGEGVLPVRCTRAPEGPLQISRFAVISPTVGSASLHSGLSHARVQLTPRLLPEILSGPVLRAEGPGAAVWPVVVDLLWSAGLLVTPGSEDHRGARQWAPCDLWFHQRSRESRGVDRYGGTYPLRDQFEPEPYDAPPAEVLERIGLPRVDVRARRLSDPSLIEVMESRRSTREFDTERAPTLAQLAELLHRTCRARRTLTAEHGLEVADRPSPAGGSIHEIDVFLGVSRCDGLGRGLWRYSPTRHELQLVTPPGPELDRLLDDARQTARSTDEPPVVLVLSARFGRIMWKYEAIPYALILKHAGVLYESFYLVATALGLGICGLGGGSTGSFAAATGADPLLEGSVGELVLGLPAGRGGPP